MSNQFGLSHVKQLTEIQEARNRHGQPGIGREVEELIRRLTSGGVAGKSNGLREARAKRLWDVGIGKDVGCSDFASYLAGIPEIPAALAEDDADFPLLVLVEPRIGLARLCERAGVALSGDDETFIACDEAHHEFTQPAWIRIQDGRKNRGRNVIDCRQSFHVDERGLTALQGVCAYVQHPEMVGDALSPDAQLLDLPGSIPRAFPRNAAWLAVWHGRPELCWRWVGGADSKCGSASRRER